MNTVERTGSRVGPKGESALRHAGPTQRRIWLATLFGLALTGAALADPLPPATQRGSVAQGPISNTAYPQPPREPGETPAQAGAPRQTPTLERAEGPTSPPPAEPGHFIEWGEAAVHESNLAQAREGAIADALGNAVAAAASQILGGEATAADPAALAKRIQGEPSRYIQNYRVLQQGPVADVYRVQIDATVLMRQLAQAFGRGGVQAQPPISQRAVGESLPAGESRAFLVELSGDLTYPRFREILETLRGSTSPTPEVGICGFRPGGVTISVRGGPSPGAVAEALRSARFTDFTVSAGATGDAFVDLVLKASLGSEIPAGAAGLEAQ